MSVLQSSFRGTMVVVEWSPSTSVTIVPTVPISCPPCSMTLRIIHHVGLAVSTCSVTFTVRDPPMSNRTINVRAVPTAGTNSRNTRLEFRPVETFMSGSGWDDYVLKPRDVSNNFCKKNFV